MTRGPDGGRLTEAGLTVLQLGKIYRPESAAFIDELARRVLVEGRHLELILWVLKLRSGLQPIDLKTHEHFCRALDRQLVAEGIIPWPKGTKKPTYIRDEPKLWNKLRLSRKPPGKVYFFKGEGFEFDWRRISALLRGV